MVYRFFDPPFEGFLRHKELATRISKRRVSRESCYFRSTGMTMNSNG